MTLREVRALGGIWFQIYVLMLALCPLLLESPLKQKLQSCLSDRCEFSFSLRIKSWLQYIWELLIFSKQSMQIRAPNLSQNSSPFLHLPRFGLVRSWRGGMRVGAMGARGRLLWGSQPFGHNQGGNPEWQFAFPADRSSLLIDYLIIDFPRSQ